MKKVLLFFKNIPFTVLLIFYIYFFQGVIHNLGHPVTPALVESMGTSDYYFGIYFAAMSLGLLVGGPIWGVLGDRGNKRLYMTLGLFVYSFGQFMFAYVGDENIMILFRFISGFGVSASVTLLLSHLIENSKDENRTTYLGWYQALFILGASAGYWIAGQMSSVQYLMDLLGTDDYRYIFYIQAFLNIFHAIFIFFAIGKDKNIPLDEKEERPNILKAFSDIRKLDKNLLIFLVSLALISLGAINISKFIEVYMNDIGLTPKNIGDFVGTTGLVSLAATIVLVPIVAKLRKDFPIMIVIQVISAIIIFFVFRTNEILVSLYTLFMLYVVLKAVYSPLEQHYISSQAPQGKYGSMMGVRQLFFAIGLVLGPLLGGLLYEISPLYVFDFSVIMFVLGFILLLIVGRRIKNGNGVTIE